jgi:membrane-associated phospholipid phosphatase
MVWLSSSQLARHRVAGCALLAALAVTASAPAEPSASSAGDPELVWRWPRFRTWEFVATGVTGTAAVAVFFLVEPRQKPRWSSGILFDDRVREAVRVQGKDGLSTVRTLSDVTGIASIAVATGIDSLLVPLVRGSPDVAVQLLLLDAEAFAISSLVTTSTFDLSGRARPSYAECQRDPSFDPLCGSGSTASFWSGHTAQAFTAAGLSCAHHTYVDLYGGGLPDALSCAGSITLGAATGYLRLAGDRHYASDVIVGAAVGFAFGFGVPTLLHYSYGDTRRRLGFTLVPLRGGLALGGAGSF